MKTDKEWSDEWTDIFTDLQSKSATEFEIEQAQDMLIKQIQYDAMKSGMLLAADVCSNSIQSQGPYFDTLIKLRASQLTAEEGYSSKEPKSEIDSLRKELEKVKLELDAKDLCILGDGWATPLEVVELKKEIDLLKNEIKKAYLEGRDDQVNVGVYRNLNGWGKSRACKFVNGESV